MIPFKLQPLLAPCRADMPSGDDLSYRSDFVELMQDVAGSPDVEYGSMCLPASDPPWAEIETRAGRLLTETHDLRLAVVLSRALQIRYGLDGLAAGLELIQELLRIDWAGIHPQLDPEDLNDPTERLNILAELCAPDWLVRLTELMVLEHPRLGALRLAVFLPTTTEQQANESLSQTGILAALQDCAPTAIAHSLRLLHGSVASAAGIERQVNEQTGLVQGLNLAPLVRTLQPALDCLHSCVADQPSSPVSLPDTHARHSGDGIHSRADIARQLDLICDYLRHHEPASPVPILLQRARRLLEMDFIEVMTDLAPGALPDIRMLLGPTHD